ncbi:hypothetical protein, partial [Caballeronia sp. AAUFL_F1_KS47]|uniref:hypothetical protein n=1 Tax=Caballeronia sp. AAUFL_F1_KS47 TaxID=2921771 RepID=UPI002027770F
MCATAYVLLLLCFEQTDLLAYQFQPLAFALNLGAQARCDRLAGGGGAGGPAGASALPVAPGVQAPPGPETVCLFWIV